MIQKHISRREGNPDERGMAELGILLVKIMGA